MSNNTEPKLLEFFPGAHPIRVPGLVAEILDLDIDAVPKGELVRSGMNQGSDNVLHIVKQGGEFFILSVCQEMPGEPGAYAIISSRAKEGTPAAETMLATYDEQVANGIIQDMPKDLSPTIKNCQEFIQKTLPERSPGQDTLIYGTWA